MTLCMQDALQQMERRRLTAGEPHSPEAQDASLRDMAPAQACHVSCEKMPTAMQCMLVVHHAAAGLGDAQQ